MVPTGPASVENDLLEFVRALKRHRAGRHALHIRLSLLSAENSGSFATRNTASFFHGLIKAGNGKLFRLSNGDVVFISQPINVTEVTALKEKIDRFFEDDSVLADNPDLLTDYFSVEDDFGILIARCEALTAEAKAPTPDDTQTPPANPFKPSEGADTNVRSMLQSTIEKTQGTKPKTTNLPRRLFFEDEEVKPFTPADLDRLESNFRILDPTNLLMDLPVAAVIGDLPPQVIFSEKAIDYDGLQAAVLPSRNLRSDANLFERLRCIIEQQLVKKLSLPPQGGALASSFASNVRTVLSGDFIGFDRSHRKHSNVPLIIDIRLQDALLHMGDFIKMRERVHEAGYRICLSGMTTYGFAALDHEHKLADFIKVSAPPDENSMNDIWKQHFHDSARKAGQSRIIFTDVENAADLEIGRTLGFSLFQGSFVNSLISDAFDSQNAPTAVAG